MVPFVLVTGECFAFLQCDRGVFELLEQALQLEFEHCERFVGFGSGIAGFVSDALHTVREDHGQSWGFGDDVQEQRPVFSQRGEHVSLLFEHEVAAGAGLSQISRHPGETGHSDSFVETCVVLHAGIFLRQFVHEVPDSSGLGCFVFSPGAVHDQVVPADFVADRFPGEPWRDEVPQIGPSQHTFVPVPVGAGQTQRRMGGGQQGHVLLRSALPALRPVFVSDTAGRLCVVQRSPGRPAF